MLATILADLYKIHLHPTMKKRFTILQNPRLEMILEPAKNRKAPITTP